MAQFNYGPQEQFLYSLVVNFGTGISFSGSTFDSIALQPGIYNIHFELPSMQSAYGQIQMIINGSLAAPDGYLNGVTWDIVNGLTYISDDRQISITAQNSTLAFSCAANCSMQATGWLVIMRLQ